MGLACGGTIDVLVEPSVPDAVRGWRPGSLGGRSSRRCPPTRRARRSGRHPRGDGAAPGATLVVGRGRDSLSGTTGDERDGSSPGERGDGRAGAGYRRGPWSSRDAWFIEAFPRRPRLVIVGAVQVAISLVALARTLGYETVVIDGRPRSPPASGSRTPISCSSAGRTSWPTGSASGRDDAVAVLTHDVKFDEPAIVTALARGCRYVGAVGSRKTQADRRERLLAAGVGRTDLARLRGPIGLDLGGREPAETALSIMSEVVAERYGGSGSPMVDRARESERAREMEAAGRVVA